MIQRKNKKTGRKSEKKERKQSLMVSVKLSKNGVTGESHKWQLGVTFGSGWGCCHSQRELELSDALSRTVKRRVRR